MNVSAILQSHYDGELSGAVWIMDTAPNRLRFENNAGLDPHSALFSVEHYETMQTALFNMIWGIQDHYPDWVAISVIGIGLNASITKNLQDDCEIAVTSDGFICTRVNRA